jgi:hypothetical protein
MMPSLEEVDMRKHLVWMLAICGAMSVTGIAMATDSTGSDFSLLASKVTPKKLSKTKFKTAKIFVDTSTLSNANPGTPTNPGNVPVPTTNVLLKFDKSQIKLAYKGLPQCKVSLEQTTTQTAEQKCGSAEVGSGAATACLGKAGVPCTSKVQFKVSAFNGPTKGGHPTLILHSRNDQLQLTTILTGTFDTKAYTLNVPIPPSVYTLATITDFFTTVKKTFKDGNTKRSYVTARCKKGKIPLKGTFSYLGGDPSDTVTSNSACTN